MENELYANIRAMLMTRPKRLTEREQWLFVAVNTAKSIIDNTDKSSSGDVAGLACCDSIGQLQHEFDIIQGRYGREGFSQRHSPAYIYLCSLVADFPEGELSDRDKELIVEYSTAEKYLLYEI